MSPRGIRHEIGQLLIAGFPGTTIPVELRALAREFSLGGIILFARNVEAPEQVAELAIDARTLTREIPPWVSVDQEGGRVARLRRPFTEWPPMRTLGRANSDDLTRRFARALAEELAAVGITLDFAPVLDVLTNRANTAIGDRAFSDDASTVARLGSIVIEELQRAGVAACGKHFPGHGDTQADSHDELPIVEHPPDRLRAIEFEPFRAAVRADVASLMVAHVLAAAFDETRPASLAPAVVRLIRDELHFDGVVFTDDLDMGAITRSWTTPDAVVQAIAAGCDGVLICQASAEVQFASLEALVRALEDGRLPYSRVEDALKRHQRMKERFLAAPLASTAPWRARRSIIGREAHAAVAAEMAQFL
ncbi:MAG TPA: beta-N-acetylhexosaminidase [Vicinamibacterales bacterium]|nr:beta-N-acetylhexosaminidase [Vicinamibacterales bacterium]